MRRLQTGGRSRSPAISESFTKSTAPTKNANEADINATAMEKVKGHEGLADSPEELQPHEIKLFANTISPCCHSAALLGAADLPEPGKPSLLHLNFCCFNQRDNAKYDEF